MLRLSTFPLFLQSERSCICVLGLSTFPLFLKQRESG
jgi:hypothetical protein